MEQEVLAETECGDACFSGKSDASIVSSLVVRLLLTDAQTLRLPLKHIRLMSLDRDAMSYHHPCCKEVNIRVRQLHERL